MKNLCLLLAGIILLAGQLMAQPGISIKVTNTPCTGTCTGSLTAVATGGSGHYLYEWVNDSTKATISNLCEGNYSVTVTDSTCAAQGGTNCSATQSANVSAVTFTSLTQSFTNTSISAGNTLWFNSGMQVSGVPANTMVTINFTGQTITFGATTINVPDAVVTISPSAIRATTSFNGTQWLDTIPTSLANSVFFLSGNRYLVPSTISGAPSVTWKGSVTSSQSGLTVKWGWGAAVYAAFNANLNALGVKPVSTSTGSIYNNNDPHGTPENYKLNVISGGTGTGGTNYTGGTNSTATVTPCPYQQMGVFGPCGYPDNSNIPRSSSTAGSSENIILLGADLGPGCTIVRAWYSDEHALTAGVRQVNIKTAAGTRTIHYPIDSFTGVNPHCAGYPFLIGDPVQTGPLSASDIGVGGGGRPLFPALFISDITANASNRSGDWEQGASGYAPTRVCGTWKYVLMTIDSTVGPPAYTITGDADPAANGSNLGTTDVPAVGLNGYTWDKYGSEIVWDLDSLGFFVQPGHSYRLEVIIHDGDLHNGGDVGELCVEESFIPTVNASVSGPTGCGADSVQLIANSTSSGATYRWSGPGGFTSNLQTPVVYASGTYSVTATNPGNTCGDSISVSSIAVTLGLPPTVTASSSSPSYCSGSTINLNSTPAGGTSPYTFNWSGPAGFISASQNPAIPNANVVNSGIYSVTVTDNKGCTGSGSTPNITVNPNLTVSAGSGNPVYCSGATISLNSSASGGTGPYTYSWAGPNAFTSNAQNPSIINSIVADSGTYHVTVTDSKGCSGTASVSVTVHQSPSLTAASSSPSYCSGATIILLSNPSSGRTPYSFNWSGPSGFSSTLQNPTRPNAAVAMSGIYDVTVTDNNACTASATTNNVTVNPSPTITASSSSPTYCAGNTIQLTSSPLGGTNPLVYNWAGPASFTSTLQNPSIANATPSNSGVYSVTVTDANTCSASATTPPITVNPGLTITLASSFTICSGNSATLTTSTTGGTAPFTYSWTSGAAPVSNPTVSPVANTSYTVTVTDSKGCSGTATTNVILHAQPTADAGPDKSIPACSITGTTIGGTPTASGGTPPYSYFWNPANGLSADSISNPVVKAIGSNTAYTVVVTDSNGCSASDAATVFVTGSTLQVTVVSNGPENWCAHSGGNVTLTAIAQNGFPPYTTFHWTGAHLSSDSTIATIANPDTAGTYLYTVVVTDTTGCQAGNTTTIIVHATPIANAGGNLDTICSGVTVTLGGGPTAVGGTPPYTYLWSGGTAPVANPMVTPLSTITYIVVVTDSNSCSATSNATVTVRQNPVADAGPDKNLPSCSPTGIQIGGSPTASGGGGAPYTYSWSPALDLITASSANPTVLGLLTDTIYTVTVKDVNGCSASDQVLVHVINNTPSVFITSGASTRWCAGSNGFTNLTANVTGGSPVFRYNWTGLNIAGVNSQVATVNPNVAGSYTYTVVVKDAFNCTATANVKVMVDTIPTANAGSRTYFICYGSGVVIGGTPTASGGTPPYTYSWNGGFITVANPLVFPTINTSYTVVVTDSNGCSASAGTVVLVDPQVIANAGPDQTTTNCSGSCVFLGGSGTGAGGTGVFTYVWSPSAHLSDTSAANPTACGLDTTTVYMVVVTDQAGCTATDQVRIFVVPSSLTAEAGSGGALCLGTGDSVMLGGFTTAVGGNPPYSYTWSPLSGLNLTNPANPEAFPASTTKYFLTVTDATGCTNVDSTTVIVYPILTVNAGRDTTVCSGIPFPLGGKPTAVGGSGAGYTYLWSPTVGVSDATLSNPVAVATATTTYQVTVTDSNGCSGTDLVLVTILPNPTANAGPDKVLFACPDDSVQLGASRTATGGTPPYIYTWSPAFGLNDSTLSNPEVRGLSADTSYILFVTDSNHCVQTDFVTVTVVQSNLTAHAGNGGSYCSGTFGSVTLGGSPTAQGGTPSYTYVWAASQGAAPANTPNPVVSPLVTTTYYLTVTDSKGCSSVDSATVVVKQSPVVNAGLDTTTCSNSTITLGGNPTASGGAGSYTYQWSQISGFNTTLANPSVSPTITTTYEVTVTDKVGCSASAAIFITVHPAPVASAGTPQTLVACSSDSVRLGGSPSATGGVGPYHYQWTPVNAGLNCDTCPNPYASHLGSSATFDLVVTDNFGCSSLPSEVTVTVTNSSLVAHAGNNVAFCQGASVNVTLGGSPTAVGGTPAYHYAWSPASVVSNPNAPNPVATVITTTTITVVVTDANGCIAQDTMVITIHPQPLVNAGFPDTICSGSTVILGGNPTAGGGTGSFKYKWTPALYFVGADTIANPTVAPTVNITYVVTVTDSLGCSNTGSVSIKVNANPVANAGTNATIVPCLLSCVTLGGTPTATNGTMPYRYAWSPNTGVNNTGLANPIVCNLGSTVDYTVTVTDANGCTATSQILVTVVPSTLAADAGNDMSVCAGQVNSVTIGGSPSAAGGSSPYTYVWQPTAGILTPNTVSNPVVDPGQTTEYILQITDALGCIVTDSVKVTVNPAVIASVAADTSICAGSCTIIGGANKSGSGGTPPFTYTWSPGTGLSSVDSSNPVACPLLTTTYCVTVMDVLGCSASACQTITVNPAVHADAGPDVTITNCPGSFTSLGGSPAATGGSGNYTYAWSPSVVGGVTVLFPTVPNPIVTGLTVTTTFTLQITDNATGCTSTDQVVVNVNQTSLTANAGNDKTYCTNSGTCVQIGGAPTATGGQGPYSYQWAPITGLNNPNIANPCASPVSTTTYYVTVTDQLGCNKIDSVNVAVSPLIVVNAGQDSSICSGTSIILGGNPTAAGGAGSFTYAWSGPGLSFLNNATIANPTAQNVTVNTSFNLVVTDGLGCSATGQVQISVRALPIASAGNPATISPCASDSVILGGAPTGSGTTAPYTYLWSPAFNIALSCSTCANPVLDSLGFTTNFCVTVTDSFGCKSTPACVLITALLNTVFVNAGGQNLPTLCSNVAGCVTLGAGNATISGGVQPYTYQWSGNGLNSNICCPSVCPSQSTTYLLIGTDSKGCQASDTVRITVNNPPVVNISGLNSHICVNAGNVLMTGTPPGGTFFGAGVTGNIFQPGTVGPGFYCIRYSYTDLSTGCHNDTTVCVTVTPLPAVNVTGYSSSYCQSDPAVTLTGIPAGGTFSGSGISGNVFNPANAIAGNDLITYSYTDTFGCSNSFQFTINVKANPSLSLSVASDTACLGQLVTFTPTYSVDVFNIVWTKLGGGNLGSGLNPITVPVNSANNSYCVVATAVNTPNGCITRDTVCLFVIQPPSVDSYTANTCEQQPVAINIGALVVDPQGYADNIAINTQPGHGTLVSTGNGNYIYTPTNYYYGLDSFKYTACSSVCPDVCRTAEVYISICYIHFPPVITDTTITIYENDSVHVCPYIYDVNNLPLVISSANCAPVNGTLTFTSDSCFEYVPTPNWVGTQILCIIVCDTAGACDTGTVTIHVTLTNVPPIALKEVLSVCKGTSIGIDVAAATGDPHGNPLTFTYGTPTGPGTATWGVTGNGALVFAANVPGVYTLPYTVCNHSPVPVFSLCASNVIVVTVINCDSIPGNDSIDANDDVVITQVSSTINTNELANDFYPNPGSLSVSVIQPPSLAGSTWGIYPNGTIWYNSPTPGNDTIVYVICDPFPLCDTATIVIVVDSEPVIVTHVPPVAVDDFDSTNYLVPTVVSVLTNDVSPNGDSLIVVAIPCAPTEGTAVINANGTITYTPGPNATSLSPDTFCYKICDYSFPNLCDTAQVVIYVRGYNVPPVAQKIEVNMCDKQLLGINVAAATVDPHGNPLTFTYGPVPNGVSLVVTGNGAIVVSATAPGVYVIPYTVCNHSPIPVFSLCSSSQIVLVITKCDTLPVTDSIKANNDGVVTNDSTNIIINELANDFYPRPGSLSVSVIQGPGLPGATFYIDGNGQIHYYSPTPGYDSIVYVICDPFPLCDTATIYIFVDSTTFPVAPPVAVNDFDSTNYGTTTTIPVLSNDYSPNGDSIFVVSIPCAATEGTAVLNANGTITYTPGPNADPQHPDSFCYKICDYVYPNLCDTAEVVIYIKDFSFVANNDTEYICSHDTITIPITANDLDAHGDSNIVVTGITNPVPNGLGNITTVTNTNITFLSNGTPGTVSFSYFICDAVIKTRCDTAAVLIHIANCPHPVIDTIFDTTFVNTPDTICVGGYVHTVTGRWHLATLCPPQNGVVVINDSCFTYIPNTGFFGNDTFCYIVCDSLGCTTSQIIITVLDTLIKAVPEACDVDSTVMNVPLILDELANDIIPHATDTVVTMQSTPEHGSAVVNPDHTITYTPNKDFTGSEQFSYMVCAVTGHYRFCDTAEICVTVVDTVHRCFIPNAFSPNGDGVNDKFVIPCNDENPKASLRVFDRWGVEVWRSNGHYNNDWDGRNEGGTLCPDGTYYAIYEYNDGVTKNQEKFVVIKR